MTISKNTMTALLEDLADRLKRARLESNLTQQALADRTGVALKTIGNAEDSGQVSLDTWLRLLDGLGRLNDLDAVLNDAGPSPIELARRSGKSRQRVRTKQRAENDAPDKWQW